MTKDTSVIAEHRNMLMISKNISTWQEAQLSNWPLVAFDTLKSVKVRYDFIGSDDMFNEGVVEYIFEFKGDAPEGADKERGLKSLTEWTKNIFWSDTSVLFKIGDQEWI